MGSDKTDVERVIDGFFKAMDRRDFKWMKQHLAHDPDMVHIGTEADEYRIGRDAMKEAIREQFRSLRSYKAALRNRVTHVGPSGDVAWFSHVMDARIESDDGTHYLENARFTGVLEKRDGVWVIVQTHMSVPE